jgi:hypothetical protein
VARPAPVRAAAAVPVEARPVLVVALVPAVLGGPVLAAVPVAQAAGSAVLVAAAASVAPLEDPVGVALVAVPVPVGAVRPSAVAEAGGPSSAVRPDAGVATSKSSKRRS